LRHLEANKYFHWIDFIPIVRSCIFIGRYVSVKRNQKVNSFSCVDSSFVIIIRVIHFQTCRIYRQHFWLIQNESVGYINPYFG